MKLYHFLFLSFFAFVSFGQNVSQNVFEFSHIGKITESVNFRLKQETRTGKIVTTFDHDFVIKIDAKLKLTISDEEDCVYFVYECQRPSNDFDSNESHLGEKISVMENAVQEAINPITFAFLIEGIEGNAIGQFYTNYGSSFVSFRSGVDNYPLILVGKLAENKKDEKEEYKLISAEGMRSKLKFNNKGTLKIGVFCYDTYQYLYK